MTYLQPRKKRSFVNAYSVTIVIIIIICAAIQFFTPHIFPGLAASISRPFWRAEFSIESGSLDSPANLLMQNEELKRKLGEVDNQVQEVKLLQDENMELKSMLGRATSSPKILAAVLKRPPLTLYDELIIDVGSDYNLATGTVVYSPNRVRIGVISDVLAGTSKVRLYSSPGEKFEVIIGHNKEPATATGRGGGQYEAKVSHEAGISEGDLVTVPSFDNQLFGVITAEISEPAEPFEKVLFASPVNVYNLRWVLVDKK